MDALNEIRKNLEIFGVNERRLNPDKMLILSEYPMETLQALKVTCRKFQNQQCQYNQFMGYWYKVTENMVGHSISPCLVGNIAKKINTQKKTCNSA